MEGDQFWGQKRGNSWNGQDHAEDGDELILWSQIQLPSIQQPQTPKEPMEFLSRSWSLSALEISKALKEKHCVLDKSPSKIPEMVVAATQQPPGKLLNWVNTRRAATIGRWFHHRESGSCGVKKKDRIRVENARVHATMAVAGLAAALASVAAAENSNGGSKMGVALASATELLASHCIEIAESAGADHDRLASVVRSAVDIQSPGDLMTLTAAAATALRGEAALKARLQKETRKNASISPYEDPFVAAFHSDEMEEQDPPCTGELQQHTPKGALRWKRVTIYINKKSQVIVKLKSKHVGGAFSKKNKCVVFGVCNETAAWPFRKERENIEMYFGLKTAQGFLEFKCKSKIHKHIWVDGIQNLLRRVSCIEATEHSLEMLNINKSSI